MTKMYILKILVLLLSVINIYCEELECPITCYCDSISKYVHCQGDKNSNSKLLPSEITKLTQRLELRNYQIGTLKWEITRDLFPSELVELSIRNSDIKEIINGSFNILIKLNNLDLSHNNINLIQLDTFNQLISLKHLDLGYNNLKEIKGNFIMLKNLETLDLNNNKLEILSIKTFKGLQNIQWIDISSNSITKIEPGTFLPMPNLERLVIGDNPLISLQRLEFLGARLRYMDVSDMKLKRAPESLGPSVRELRATRNEFKILRRGDLDSYPSLTLLDLSNNQLNIIEDDALGRLEYLSRIYLIDNKLEKIPKSLPRILKILYLDNNKITSINTSDLQGLPKLQNLSLKNNKLMIISSEFMAFLPGLRKLDLSQNLFKIIIFSNNNLEELNLSDNSQLELKSDTFNTLTHLSILHLANITKVFENNIKEIITPLLELSTLNLQGSPLLVKEALNLQIWFGLHELNIQNSSINTLPDELWNSMGKLKVIYLSKNNWNCTPEFQIKISSRDLKLKIMDESILKCEFPENLRGTSLILYNITKEATVPPSLAPTRVQIISPIKNATIKPESTAPLNYHENSIKNEVKKPKKDKIELQILTSINKMNISINFTDKNIAVTTPFNSTEIIFTTSKTENNTDNITKNSDDKTKIDDTTNKNDITTPKQEVTTQKYITTTEKEVPITKNKVPTTKNGILTTIKDITTTIKDTTTSKNDIITTLKIDATTMEIDVNTTQSPMDIITTAFPPMDYEELAVVIDEEEFYEEPGNFSELRAGQIRAITQQQHNIPVGFLSIIGACMLGALILGAYHYRQARKWQRLKPSEDNNMLYMDTLSYETERLRW